MRVDKWLWTARLFKTRALAAGAIKGGRVHINGTAAKPSREVGPGDQLEITIGALRRTVRGDTDRTRILGSLVLVGGVLFVALHTVSGVGITAVQIQ